jgi:hypothetical protein
MRQRVGKIIFDSAHVNGLTIARIDAAATTSEYDRDDGRRLDNGYQRHCRDG